MDEYGAEEEAGEEVGVAEVVGERELGLEVGELGDVEEAFAHGQVERDVVLVVAEDANEVELELVQLLLVRLEALQVLGHQGEEELLVQDVQAFLENRKQFRDEIVAAENRIIRVMRRWAALLFLRVGLGEYP